MSGIRRPSSIILLSSRHADSAHTIAASQLDQSKKPSLPEASFLSYMKSPVCIPNKNKIKSMFRNIAEHKPRTSGPSMTRPVPIRRLRVFSYPFFHFPPTPFAIFRMRKLFAAFSPLIVPYSRFSYSPMPSIIIASEMKFRFAG